MPESGDYTPPPSLTEDTTVEDCICAWIRAPAELMATASSLAVLQWEFMSQLVLASFEPMDGFQPLGPTTLVDTLTNRFLFDVDFLLGMRGEEQAFPE